MAADVLTGEPLAAIAPPEKARERPHAVQAIEEPTSDSVVARLMDAQAADRNINRLVIDAELLPLSEEQANQLRPILLKFITRNRDSTDAADLVAVASAIRK